MSQSVARRYAKALLELLTVSEFDVVELKLKEIAELWSGSAELRQALRNPSNPLTERRKVLTDIVQRLSGNAANEKISNLLWLLLENERLNLLPAVLVAFQQIVAEVKKLLALEVTSARELTADDRTALSAEVRKNFGDMATIAWRVDSSIIGGLQVKVGDRLLDSSVSGALERMRAELLGAAA